jgi:hypothetical protein
VERAGVLREVHTAEAVAWLRGRGVLAGCSVITSLPDVSELPALDLSGWQRWFLDAARQVLRAGPDDGIAVFYQSDIKKAGAWIDKGYLCSRAAEHEGFHTLFHKVVCRRPPGTATFGRAAWSHLLAFSRGIRIPPAVALPDVLADAGEANWTRGMGTQACKLACRAVLTHTATRTVVDPFCGRGMVLAVANALGLNAIGVELSARRARQARAASVPQDFR